ncbi:hypothetical protein [Streptomyces sp. ISL-11]|uniref:hypothetical protein n=1 Tax=Streptomyces sp. ISL-11 TaxID=2819174 RepID=UPI001BEB9FD2|nr:hypothetical protein [Streptomyces sp. ISL-11]MBT2384490.1 hypothetical protein [Streptomyces sp. ISL-11]
MTTAVQGPAQPGLGAAVAGPGMTAHHTGAGVQEEGCLGGVAVVVCQEERHPCPGLDP